MYIIKVVEEGFNFSDIPAVYISHHPFGGGKCPKTQCRLCYVKDKGFALQMICEEEEPLARYSNADDPVYKDSCLEFFADFFPVSEQGYLNFEINANGAMLCMLGKTREKRPFVKDIGLPPPKPLVFVSKENWRIELFIPLSYIQSVYGRIDFHPGSIIRGNFYKCGDETPVPHWGCWHPLGENPVDFHQPETFGIMCIENT